MGASADNPNEGALVIQVSGSTIPRVPPTIDGVRTRLVFDEAAGAQPFLRLESRKSIEHIAVKETHVADFMGHPGIQGVGVSLSVDNPTETAVSIYVIKGVVPSANSGGD